MDSTNERLETTDKLVLRIENWLKKLAENNESSMNQTHLLDQSLIELTHEVSILFWTFFFCKILLVFNYLSWLSITQYIVHYYLFVGYLKKATRSYSNRKSKLLLWFQVDRLNQTLQPEIDRLISEWNKSQISLKQEHDEQNTVINYILFKLITVSNYVGRYHHYIFMGYLLFYF